MHGHPVTLDAGDAGDAAVGSRRPRLAVAGVLAALLLTAIDHTIINVALPELVRSTGASGGDLQWIADAYVVVFAGTLLTAGAAGDRYGRRAALMVGLVVFAAGSTVAAAAASPGTVIVGRAVMGLGGAAIMPATLSSLIAMFDGHQRARAVAAWAATASIGVAVGPLVGGWLVGAAGWSSVFWVNVPVAVGAAIVVVAAVPETRVPSKRRLDIPGALLSVAAAAGVVWAVIEAPHDGWTSAPSVARFAGAAFAAGAFVASQIWRPDPMLDLRLIRRARIGVASAAITLAFFALGGAMFLVAQYLQFVLGYSPLAAGAALLPAAAGLALGSHAVARHPHAGGPAVAAGILVAGWGLLVQAVHANGSSYVPTGIGLFLVGGGLGVAVPGATHAIVGGMPDGHAGVASAINDTVREIGSALGIAVLGSVVASRYRSELDETVGPTPEAARDGIGSALEAADRLGAAGAELAAAARDAFVGAFRAGLSIGAAIAVAGAVVARRWYRADLRWRASAREGVG